CSTANSELCLTITLCYFFFQAEDGIRDFHVTGVQTCALPISDRKVFTGANIQKILFIVILHQEITSFCQVIDVKKLTHGSARTRSEERRVGKEGRSARSAYTRRKEDRLHAERCTIYTTLTLRS